MKSSNSIFDEYHTNKDTNATFGWCDFIGTTFNAEKEQIFCDGKLTEYNQLSKEYSPECYYILSKNKLFKFVNESSKIPIKFLEFLYPRLEIIENSSHNKQYYNFSLTSLGKTIAFKCKIISETELWIFNLKTHPSIVLKNLLHDYSIGKILGTGNYAKVRLATKIGTDKMFACKSIHKKKLSGHPFHLNSVISEIDILRALKHPRIINLYEVYEGKEHIHFIMEYLAGGELFEKIREKGSYNESDAIRIMGRLLEVVGYMHSKRYIHRDLKPENIILLNSDSDLNFKVTDFGLATYLEEGKKATHRCGSPGYAAPEILKKQEYDFKVDVFSCGVILYALLTGFSPFCASNVEGILEKNEKMDIDFSEDTWKLVSKEGKDLVRKMLEKEPQKRLAITDCLRHDWFKKEQSSEKCVQLVSALENMKKYNRVGAVRFDVSLIKPFSFASSSFHMSPPGSPKHEQIVTKVKKPISSANLLANICEKPPEGRTRFYSRDGNDMYDHENLLNNAEDDIPDEHGNSETKIGPIKYHNSFAPEEDEMREIPITPGSSGGSKQILESSLHLTCSQSAPHPLKKGTFPQMMKNKKPVKISQFKSEAVKMEIHGDIEAEVEDSSEEINERKSNEINLTEYKTALSKVLNEEDY